MIVIVGCANVIICVHFLISDNRLLQVMVAESSVRDKTSMLKSALGSLEVSPPCHVMLVLCYCCLL